MLQSLPCDATLELVHFKIKYSGVYRTNLDFENLHFLIFWIPKFGKSGRAWARLGSSLGRAWAGLALGLDRAWAGLGQGLGRALDRAWAGPWSGLLLFDESCIQTEFVWDHYFDTLSD